MHWQSKVDRIHKGIATPIRQGIRANAHERTRRQSAFGKNDANVYFDAKANRIVNRNVDCRHRLRQDGFEGKLCRPT